MRFVTDTLGNVTEHQYDARNRLIKTILPDLDGAGGADSPELEWSYDDAGQLVSQTDAPDKAMASSCVQLAAAVYSTGGRCWVP